MSQTLRSSRGSAHAAPRRAASSTDQTADPAAPKLGLHRRRPVRIGLAGLAALAVLSGASYAARPDLPATAEPAPASAASVDYAARGERANRDTERPTLDPSASPSSSGSATPAAKKPTTAVSSTPKTPAAVKTVGTRYARVALNVRSSPTDGAQLLDVVKAGAKVSVAGTVKGAWQGIVVDGTLAWVKRQYLVTTKPGTTSTSTSSSNSTSSAGASSAAISGSACTTGSSVESGLTRDAIAVHRAVCARFPQIRSYGGVRADSLPEHPSGRALDCMLPNYSSASGNALGWEIANWLRANASRLGISQILYDQRIWTVQRGSEGWRWMSNRGGATANHQDHVHVTVYGNAS